MQVEPTRRVRMLKTVKPDFPFSLIPELVATEGEEYPVEVNQHGALTAIIGRKTLGLKPGEYVFVELKGQPAIDVLREVAAFLDEKPDRSLHTCTVLAQRVREAVKAFDAPDGYLIN